MLLSIIGSLDWIALIGALFALTFAPIFTGKIMASCDKTPKTRYDRE